MVMEKRYMLRWYLAGATAARTGDEMSGPALLLAGFAATGSPSSASALLAGLTISAAVGGPLVGVLLDRSERPGRVLAGALALYAAALAVILESLGRVPVAVTVLIAACAGLLGPALSGGWTSQLPYAASRKALPRAHALDAMTFSFASLVGPALAGLLAGSAGAPTGVALSAALICFALPAAWALPARRVTSTAAPVLTDLASGFRSLTHTRPLARATATSTLSCVGAGILTACTPLLGERVLGDAGRGALLLSGIAVCALAANTVLARHPGLMRPDSVIRYSTLVLAAALLLASTGVPVLLIAAVVLTGAGEGPQLAALFAVRHREASDRLRAQIFTTGASLKLTGFAVGAALAGPLATWSLPGALLTAAGFQLLATLAFTVLTPADADR